MDDIDAAVRSTGRTFRKARPAHVAAVLDALRAGKPPTDVAKMSEFSESYVRRLARDAGIPPAQRGRKSRSD